MFRSRYDLRKSGMKKHHRSPLWLGALAVSLLVSKQLAKLLSEAYQDEGTKQTQTNASAGEHLSSMKEPPCVDFGWFFAVNQSVVHLRQPRLGTCSGACLD